MWRPCSVSTSHPSQPNWHRFLRWRPTSCVLFPGTQQPLPNYESSSKRMPPGRGLLPALLRFANSRHSSPHHLSFYISTWWAPQFWSVMPPMQQSGLCCPKSSTALNALWPSPLGPSAQLNKSTQWGSKRHWPVSGHVNGGMYVYGRYFTLRTDHQALTVLLTTTGLGHKPLRIHR